MESQIDQLERVVLPIGKAILLPSPRRADVREELQAVLKALQGAQKAMTTLLRSKSQTSARNEALQRVWLADTEIRDEHDCIDKALDAVNIAHSATEKAMVDLPKEQLRRRANPFLIRRIEKALLDGFIKGHSVNNPDGPLPPYTLKSSSSPGSPFREIVGICFEAMGQKNADPERAIKQHIAKCKQSVTWQRQTIAMKNPDT